MSDARAIGFFDSGVGGLTVLREVMRRLPHESTIYLGDNARAPYGPRSDDEVNRFSAQCLDELASRDVKAIVVACNTSSAIALPQPAPALQPAAARRGPARRDRGRARDAQPARRRDRARRRRSARMRISRRSRKRIRSSRCSSTRRRSWCPWSRPASSKGRSSRRSCSEQIAPDARIASAASTRCCSAAPTTRCSRPSSGASSAAMLP